MHLLDKIYFVFIIYLNHLQYIYYVFHCFIYYLITVLLEMPHHCIVPLCTNNSKLPELFFYHLPLHGKKLLLRWLEEWILMWMSIQEFAVLILKGVGNREKMLCPQYLHGLKNHLPLEHLPRNVVLLFELQLPILLVLQHLCLQRITWVFVPRIWLFALLWTRKLWWN